MSDLGSGGAGEHVGMPWNIQCRVKPARPCRTVPSEFTRRRLGSSDARYTEEALGLHDKRMGGNRCRRASV